MESLAPLGRVYQAGTLSGNPVAVAAGMATLEVLRDSDPYAELATKGQRLASALDELGVSLPMHCSQMGGMFTPFFCRGPVRNVDEARAADTVMFARFFNRMLAAGFYLTPSQFEVAFVSTAHSNADIDAFVEAATEAATEP